MRSFWKDLLTAIFMGMILPGLLLNTIVKLNPPEPEQTGENPETSQPTIARETGLSVSLLRKDGSVCRLEMEEYLTGVVLAEMPASFESEALKAQAVVARTYTLKVAQAGYKHENADVCTDYACCQAYTDAESYTGGQANLEKVRSAVIATGDLVLIYEGNLIEATYFSCSGGSTEDAVAVWGTDYPYLRATESPGEENAAYFTDTVSFASSDFADTLGVSGTGSPDTWFGFTTYTAGGGVNTMRICGHDFSGTELRMRLGLRSTNFTVDVVGDMITITTKGFGHRVGMSQYGADAMAVNGHTFEEILKHYYRGTELVSFGD